MEYGANKKQISKVLLYRIRHLKCDTHDERVRASGPQAINVVFHLHLRFTLLPPRYFTGTHPIDFPRSSMHTKVGGSEAHLHILIDQTRHSTLYQACRAIMSALHALSKARKHCGEG